MAKVKHKKARLFGRIVLIIIAIFVVILLILTALFDYYKDDIGREILLRINKVQPGELTFKDIAFNPFSHLPNVSIKLNDVDYFEQKDQGRKNDSLPIIELENLYFAFDVIDLMKGNINVAQIILDSGEINLMTYADSSFNLINAIGLPLDTLPYNPDTTIKKHADFDLDLKRIEMKGIKVNYTNVPENTNSSYTIKALDASLSYQDEKIKSEVETNFDLNKLNHTGGFLLSNKHLSLESSLIYDKNTHTIQIEPSKLHFDKASFKIEGKLDLSSSKYIDISVAGNDNDFSVLSLFLSETGMKNIIAGDLYFKGSIKGNLSIGIPMIDFSYGLSDVEIKIPNTSESISKLSFKGNFNSGNQKDLSKATLIINELKANLPGGSLNGRFSINNFVTPKLDVDFHMAADIFGFDKIFNFGLTDSLKGKIIVDAEFNGTFDPTMNKFDNELDSSHIVFENVSFLLPEVNHVNNLNGEIQFESDSTYLNDLEFEIGTSDFIINGSSTHLIKLFLNLDQEIFGKLLINSNVYDFPNFFDYDPKVASSFPYRIKEIDLNVNIYTSINAFTDSVVVPKIVFDIKSLKAEIENFLPPIEINEGVFTLGVIDSSLNLDFSDFDIEITGSKLLMDVVFNSPKKDPNWLKIDLSIANLNPQKTFVYWSQDSISNDLNGKMDGSVHLDLIFSLDTIVFDKLDFNAESLGFINFTDTFNFGQLNLRSKQIDFDITKSNNILETLSFDADLAIKELNTNHFNADDLDYDIKAIKGIYNITLNHSQFFNQIGEGTVILNPFGEIPKYEIKYKVKQFEVSKLFDTFKEDTIARGKMDLDLSLRFKGSDLEEIKHSMDGRILLGGKNLTLYGLDLDKVIDRFKRSQSFNLADVGAVVLMGPAGLLVTKGSDFASLVVLNPGELSKIIELSSDWEFNNGIMNLADVAFTTQENRMAAKGWVDLITDSLSIELALLNELGCSVYSQEMFGKTDSLEFGKIKVVKSLLAPVTNLLSIENKCDVFYNGKVKQPKKQKKEELKSEL